jgi:hypothetical protein
MRIDDFEDSRRLAPVWRRIMILLAVIAAVPVVLWSITAFVRAYVAPPKVPTFRPITATASVPLAAPPAANDAKVPAAPARALAAIVRKTTTEDAKRAAPAPAPVIEAKATTSDTPDLSPRPDNPATPVIAAPEPTDTGADRQRPAAAAANDAAPAEPAAPWPAAPAVAAPPPPPPAPPAQVAVETPPAAEPFSGPVPLPPHRPHVFAMVQGAIPVPRPRPTVPGDPATAAPITVDLSARDYMR